MTDVQTGEVGPIPQFNLGSMILCETFWRADLTEEASSFMNFALQYV
jgi:hypothetical protein